MKTYSTAKAANEHANRADIENDWYIIRGSRRTDADLPIAWQPPAVDDARFGVVWANLHPRLACEWIDVKKRTEDSKHYTWIFNFFFVLRSIPFLSNSSYMQNGMNDGRFVCELDAGCWIWEQNNTYRWNIIWTKSDFLHVRGTKKNNKKNGVHIYEMNANKFRIRVLTFIQHASQI